MKFKFCLIYVSLIFIWSMFREALLYLVFKRTYEGACNNIQLLVDGANEFIDNMNEFGRDIPCEIAFYYLDTLFTVAY